MPTDPPVDPRSLRFSAWLTTVVLAVVLVTGSALLLGVQALAFALGAFAGLRFSPYTVLYRGLVAPRIAARFGPPASKEDAAPSRFAQGVGFAFAAIGAVGYGDRSEHARCHRDRIRARGCLPQRRLRVLPRLRGTPAPAPGAAPSGPVRPSPGRVAPGS